MRKLLECSQIGDENRAQIRNDLLQFNSATSIRDRYRVVKPSPKYLLQNDYAIESNLSRVIGSRLTAIQFEIIDFGATQAPGTDCLPHCFNFSRIRLPEFRHREQTMLAGQFITTSYPGSASPPAGSMPLTLSRPHFLTRTLETRTRHSSPASRLGQDFLYSH